MKNPLLSQFGTPHEAAPFSKIKPEHFIPALQETIAFTLKEIDAITAQARTPSFENTLEALENCGTLIDRNISLLFNLNSAETSEVLQKTTQEAAPILAKFRNDIRLNEALFARIKSVFENEDRSRLSPEQQTLLEKEYKGFVRNGALLSVKEKERLRGIDTELAQLGLTFGENVLADRQAFQLHLENPDDLKGIPQNIQEMAAETAAQKDKKGWVFTLDYPSYLPFMTYAENRSLRKKMSLAFGSIGFQDNTNNNTEIILRLIRLRKERANLLGYASHTHFVLEERMAVSEENVRSFLGNLYQAALPPAKREWQEMEVFASKNQLLDTLEKWDTAFVSEKLKQATLELDEQMLKPYFPLEETLQGLFQIVKKLFGIHFQKNEQLEGYHQDVNVYEVLTSEDAFHGLLYTDFHPRPGKRAGAWMTSYRSQKKGQRPHVSIVCNFSKPTASQPSLLTFQEVTTLFHEFGHALHGLMANTTYSGLSGTSVYWDFVELPSQLMENWCYQEDALALFAKHYKTQETLPKDLISKIKKVAYFQQGLQTLRQLGFGYLDLSYHGADAPQISNIKAHELKQVQKTVFTPDVSENCSSTAFSHIFQGGYASGYYSYKWAEVLDADAFESFLENGIFDEATAQSFLEHILSKGGTEHPTVLYKRFKGREPDPKALLRRAGLV